MEQGLHKLMDGSVSSPPWAGRVGPYLEYVSVPVKINHWSSRMTSVKCSHLPPGN